MTTMAIELPKSENTRLRRLSESLPKLKVNDPTAECGVPDENPSPEIVPPPSREEIVEEGKELFGSLLCNELEKKGISTPQEVLSDFGICTTPYDDHHNFARSLGREFRMIADDFAKTKEREKVQAMANGISIRQVTYEKFRSILTGLFSDEGVTITRIVVLFFFCADVAIRALKEGVKLFRQFITWSMQFIAEKVCSWVQENGGWEAVLHTSLNYLRKAILYLGAAFVIFVVCKKTLF
ncbi:hypothetical protein CHS0354_027870 [Potamilus streckersoni]|uniref:Bcl-2 Bcl-2 homology region 1-3 domain-containing protein n=1 Tax=Potamilus streckersoni TaxID=2493646 RepID=A0AAE0W6P5_9BIVA|nr:hypothetical protein CHS0354_027870 [Potamilus streckersoni]